MTVSIKDNTISTRDINKQIKEKLNEDNNVFIENSERLDSVAVGINKRTKLELNGEFGEFTGALNNGANIIINGSVGRYLGNNMTDGEIILNGNAGDGVGFGICGGTIVVKGTAGDAVGQLSKGGTILIDGSIGDLSGLFMLNGTIIITGDAGESTGDWMIGGEIFIGGEFRPGHNAKEVKLTETDKTKLKELFNKYDIDADVDNFKKYQKDKIRPFYG